MGTYIDKKAIENYLGSVIGEYTLPDNNNIDTVIAGYEARVESAGRKWGATPPFTSPADLAMIRLPLTQGVSCQAFHTYVLDELERPAVTNWCKEWSDFISALESGNITLPSVIGDEDVPQSGVTTIPMRRA